jgi:hypothetical protein
MYKVKKEYQNLTDKEIKGKIYNSLSKLEERLEGNGKDTRRINKTGGATTNDDWDDLLLRLSCLRIDKKKKCK